MKPIHASTPFVVLLVGLALGHVASAATFYVDPVDGLDANPGSYAQPVQTIKQAGFLAGPGDTVYLRGTGHFPYSDFDAANWSGTAGNVITVQSYPGEKAVFDPGYAEFKTAPNTAWVHCTDPGAHRDEYISLNTYSTETAYGTFLGSGDRLLCYDRVEDFRSTNESFVKVPISDSRQGAPIWGAVGNKFLWTYRGPGLWWHSATQKIHARFSATHYNQPGVTDYGGGNDPGQFSLSISSYGKVAVSVEASYITFNNIVFQNGGAQTISVYNNNHVTFDHCTINAGRYAIRIALTSFLTLQHCVIDSHLASYTCRSDVKDSWDIVNYQQQQQRVYGCTRTSQMQLVTNCDSQDLEIANCEFRNCHDSVQVYDMRTKIHDCLFENINDDVFSFETNTNADDVRVYNNVIRQALSVYSFAQKGTVTGKRYIYRNVLDNRIPTLGSRVMAPDTPPADTTAIWRTGSDFKMNFPVGEFYCYQNTFIQGDTDAFCSAAFGDCDTNNLKNRRFMNNIHMSILADKRLYTIPNPVFPVISDGNVWWRAGNTLTFVLFYTYAGPTLATWTDMRNSYIWANYYNANGVGWETHSQLVYPQFAGVADMGYSYRIPYPNTDYRLKSTSPARGAGCELPRSWPDSKKHSTTPDVGAIPYGALALAVGVDGRFVFPSATLPIAEAGDFSIINDANGDGFETVSLDGSGSSDPDGSITSYSWVLNGLTIGSSKIVAKALPIGTHQIQLTVKDNVGNAATDLREITIKK